MRLLILLLFVLLAEHWGIALEIDQHQEFYTFLVLYCLALDIFKK